MKRSRHSGILCTVSIGALAGVSVGQPLGTWTPDMRRIDADYTPNASSGQCVLGRNRDAKCFNFSILRPDSTRRGIPMADPTALVINDSSGIPWVYVTGTCDWANTANFCIYKSKDLINWYPHATAFKDANRVDHSTGTGPWAPPDPADTLFIRPNTSPWGGDLLRVYMPDSSWFQMTQMWAPELFIDPVFPDRVTMSFTAKVWDNPLHDYTTPWWSGHANGQPAVYNVSVPLTEFVKCYTDSSKVYFGDPVYAPVETYVYNDQAVSWWDGGQHLSPLRTVPVSGYRYATDTSGNPGTATFSGGVFTHVGVNDARSWPALDSFVYFETDNRPWFLYAYFSPQTRISAHPMINTVTTQWWFRQRCMDQNASPLGLTDMARPTNPNNRLDAVDGAGAGTQYNGSLGNVCEGPAVFRRTTTGTSPTTYTYLLYSRNGTISPAYGIYWRKTAGHIQDLAVPALPTEPAEGVLIQAARRLLTGGVSFGHGEVFQFFGRYYLICHMKETQDSTGGFPLFPYGARTVYFKELSFNESTGDILSLSCDQTNPALDIDVFLSPYSDTGGFNTTPVCGDE